MASATLNKIRDFEERIEDAWWSYLELGTSYFPIPSTVQSHEQYNDHQEDALLEALHCKMLGTTTGVEYLDVPRMVENNFPECVHFLKVARRAITNNDLGFAGRSLEDAQISVEMLETVIEETRTAVEDLVALANVLAANERLDPGEVDIQAREQDLKDWVQMLRGFQDELGTDDWMEY
ncbi:hypothetical protein LTR86_004834 [Recurvomyces mirabilis]|nr:hypothetical protein LTR86_004834 [Recurvomyces mirabilis]